MKTLMNTIIAAAFISIMLSSCGTDLLIAKFESATDVINSLPDRTLPNSPSGDELSFIPEIEGQLRVVASTPAVDGSTKSLRYTATRITGNPGRSAQWLSFKGAPYNFNRTTTFIWTATQTAGVSVLNIDISDGLANVAARIHLSPSGNVYLIPDLASSAGTLIGNIPPGEKHSFFVAVNRARSTYNIGISKPSGTISRNEIPLVNSSLSNTGRPTLSFLFQDTGSTQSYTIDEAFIKRRN